MGISHLTINLGLWNQSCNRVHDHNIYCAGTNHGLGNFQSLLTVIRLRNVEIVNIHTDILCIYRIQRMLCVNEAGNAAALLYLCNHVECYRGFTTGLRSVDLNDTALRHTAKAQRDIQTDGTGRNGFNIHIGAGIAQFHDRALSVRLLNLCDGSVQCF